MSEVILLIISKLLGSVDISTEPDECTDKT